MKIVLLTVLVFVAVFAVLLLVGALLGIAAGRKHRVGPFRFGSPDHDEIERAAAEDVAAVRESDRYFRRDAPGRDPDDL